MNNFLYYPFAYLVLEQNFLCTSGASENFTECTSSQICKARNDPDSTLTYKVDRNYAYYLENWYLQMDLVCTPPATIGLVITAYYIGFAVGGLFFSFPEKYGRKRSVIFGMVISLVS